MSQFFEKKEQHENFFSDLLISELSDRVLFQIKNDCPFLFFQNKNALPTCAIDKDDQTTDLISPSLVMKLTDPPISRTNLFYWTKAGKLKAFKVGKRVFYSKKAVLTFLTSVTKKPPKI